jgi:hypothetical protein
MIFDTLDQLIKTGLRIKLFQIGVLNEKMKNRRKTMDEISRAMTDVQRNLTGGVSKNYVAVEKQNFCCARTGQGKNPV